ncbi:metallopeptidase family M24 protein (macronuclear) [Tetrahymena thermophila SB210]|uniref:Xaa-Pro dipeptidase n=1 Tax=Tetrahymena thermophila (strain SB210) TaxID=312017 RepID=I7MK96_TETTS|nr:metallopeptidase family M24 protein [Tetrahymena thermophila SB210]EAR97910.1 metallopeptidase family M24 protein [Tetrahymena thermophila SB210]|eukprot:XP_001018155.1 metallopeptidase family M24 protein [Tetrahymena thermophila SB210]
MECRRKFDKILSEQTLKLELPVSFHKKVRQTLIDAMKKNGNIKERSIVLLKGDTIKFMHDQDIVEEFQQEANIFYLFGVREFDCHGVLELDTGKAFLFCRKIPDEWKIWITVKEPPFFKQQYQVDDAWFDTEMENYLKQKNPEEIHIYHGIDSDSGLSLPEPSFECLKNYTVVKDKLYDILNELRVIKHPEEIEQMKFVGRISSDAHLRVMNNIKAGMMEYQMEALYKFHVHELIGSKEKSYNCICASGDAPALLHYIDNEKQIPDNALILNDMGSKYNGYTSDITITFPSNGKFSQKQKEIYNAVYEAYTAVLSKVKAGVSWEEMHFLAERIILQHLIKLGLVVDTPIQELIEKRVSAMFFPHGLGHFMGLRVHDVGGYNPGHPPKLKDVAGLRSLRTRRVLQEGMCISVEPGCYFNKSLLHLAFNHPVVSKYLVKEKINEYLEVSGVRLEDNIVITKDGYINFTEVPRTIEEVERACAGLPWKD